jgi:predicted nucleic-acid-binding Zn-ribbon protein
MFARCTNCDYSSEDGKSQIQLSKIVDEDGGNLAIAENEDSSCPKCKKKNTLRVD